MNASISGALRPTFGAFTRRQGLQWLAAFPFLSDAQAAPTGVQLASDWPVGRSQALFKFKPEPDDEAQVVSHLPGGGAGCG